MAEIEKFRNTVSRRFYYYFKERLSNKDIDADKFYSDFEVENVSNRSVFLNALKYGQKSITVRQIELARNIYNVNPDFLFGFTDVATTEGEHIMSEASDVYGEEYRKDVGRKLREIFEKHKTNISQYAQERLSMTEQNLYKILRGQGRPYWDMIVTVCEDHSESLDLFRTKPLPKGHFLEQLASMKSENAALKSVNEILKGKVKELETLK